MPPKVRITQEMIVEAGFAIVREEGAHALNARTVAQRLGCSTQPVLYQFATVDDMRKAVYTCADAFHAEYLMQGMEESEMPLLTLGQNYIRFAAQEARLFRFLFQSSGLGSGNVMELVNDPTLSPMLEILQQAAGVTPEAARRIFLQLFLTIHGYASLLANNPMPYNENEAALLLDSAFTGACAAEAITKEDHS
ncbi:MAG: WHG domain-containing protein [Clostridia bacterium]|nr:WHG domain-containing protein [Clostridia bacterium]